MNSQWLLLEQSPSAASTVASSASVQNSANYLPGGVAGPLDDFIALNVIATVQGATGGTLDIYGQMSPDDGGTWYDIFHLPQLAAAAASTTYGFGLGIENASITAIGSGLSPALAANTLALGGWASRLRLVFVAGGGTSLGATQKVWVQAQRPAYSKQF